MFSRFILFFAVACSTAASGCSELIGADFDDKRVRQNQPPIAADARLDNVVEGTTGHTLQLTASDPENKALEYYFVSQPRGRAAIDASGLLSYESEFGVWDGGVEDEFRYGVRDGANSAEATVKIGLLPAGPRQIDPPLGASAASHVHFGASVDFDGDRAIVGSTYDGAYILRRQTDGTWKDPTKILPPNKAAQESAFGIKAALSGDWAVVGAYGFWDSGISPPGKAFFFKWNGEQYVLMQTVCGVADADPDSCDTGPADRFGLDLALEGGVAAIAAKDDPANEDPSNVKAVAGAVYVYELEPGRDRWRRVAKLRAPAPAAGEQFGASIALDGETLAVGAPGTDTSSVAGGAELSGAVYVFEKGPGWQSGARGTRLLLPSRPHGLKKYQMGQVALSGDRLLCGVPEAVANPTDPLDTDKRGIAFLYERDDQSGWQDAPHTLYHPPDPSGAATVVGARFGTAVAIDGDVAVVTRRGSNDNGAVFMFRREIRPGPQWILRRTHVNTRATSFGWSAAVDGTSVLVGAPHGAFGEAQAFLFPPEPNVKFLCSEASFHADECAQSTIAPRSGQLFSR